MRILSLVPLLFALGAASPALAAVKVYDLSGDESTLFPTCGVILRPEAVTGRAIIEDRSDGTPTLLSLEIEVRTAEIIGYFSTGGGIPGSTVFFGWTHQLAPSPGQTGTGSTASSISWEALTGWTSTGYLECETRCPGGCPPFFSQCIPFVGFEGIGPPPPVEMTEFDSDPWVFTPDGVDFESASIQIVNLQNGVVTENIMWRGALLPTVPALPGAALAGLALALGALGLRALRRR